MLTKLTLAGLSGLLALLAVMLLQVGSGPLATRQAEAVINCGTTHALTVEIQHGDTSGRINFDGSRVRITPDPRDGAGQFRSMITKAAPDAEINLIPALRGSVTEFAGQRVDELAELPEGAWVLRGDRGLTYSPTLPNGSELTAGSWWAADYEGPPLVSVAATSTAMVISHRGVCSSMSGEKPLPSSTPSTTSIDWRSLLGMPICVPDMAATVHATPAPIIQASGMRRKLKAMPPAAPMASASSTGRHPT